MCERGSEPNHKQSGQSLRWGLVYAKSKFQSRNMRLFVRRVLRARDRTEAVTMPRI